MTELSDFKGLYPVSKTLRFEMRPVGKTMEKFAESGFLEDDQKKADEYTVMKEIIDDYHRKFIDETLSECNLDWHPLNEALKKSKTIKDDKSKKELEKEQVRMQKLIIGLFSSRPEFKDLFSEKLFSKILSKEIKERGLSDEIRALDAFDKFSGYFIGFHENRKNMYSDEKESTSIAYRIVHQNFPKYADNCSKYEFVNKEMPEVIPQFKKEIEGQLHVEVNDFFNVDSFNRVLTQSGIEEYNTVIGGMTTENAKIRGINEFLNLYNQAAKTDKKVKMSPLYKQILSKTNSYSFIPKSFESKEEVMNSIESYYDSIRFEIIQRSSLLMKNYRDYDLSKIYVDQKYIPYLSQILFGQWDILGGLMQIHKAEEIGDPSMEKTRKKVDKWLSSKEFQLDVIVKCVQDEVDFFKKYSQLIDDVLMNIESTDKSCLKTCVDEDSWKNDLKSLLDSFTSLVHLLKPFRVKEELDLDPGFYSEFNEIFESLSAVVSLYDKVRNFVTKTPYSTKKIKMNFGNPTLAAGWDLNKERDNTAVLFVRKGKYFLGIMNPKKKIDFSAIEDSSSDTGYQKMVYKLLPGPNKMLPKVFFSDKGRNTFNVSDDLLEKYNAGLYKKGDKFDIKFCHELIDFFKENIGKYEGWDTFDFKFSPTESYEDISQFYKEVADQGYKIKYANIPETAIDSLIDSGRLFLFQLYTKDFSDYSTGKKNLHTLYWNAAFSPENLADVNIRINGDAELFYREKSDFEKIVHKKGTTLVNRTDKYGNPIPNNIYSELFRYKVGIITDLSPETRTYLDNIVTLESKYDVVKDRRYTVDKMFFHIPLTFNFKADEKKNINKLAIDFVKNNGDVHYIGIDRGERNLIYVSVINKDGKIVRQKDFNVINKVDYHKKLDVREKDRADARVQWNSVEKIKDLKEGYLSQVIHEISKMIIEYNAVVILEDLNFGFKRGRFKVEKQVYQKFEKMLIDKLNFLSFKDESINSPGGILNAYQLTDKFESFQKLGKQSGLLFYIPASYTSVIDPTTGFVDLFNTSSIRNNGQKIDFLSRMKSIRYNAADSGFDFEFDYRDFDTSNTDYRNVWIVSTRGERIRYDRKERINKKIDATSEIVSALSNCNIPFTDGDDIKDAILSSGDNDLLNVVYYAFTVSLKMRNSDSTVDYIQSPVKNKFGRYFVSGSDESLPKDADANGAYHIALKGKMMIESVEYDPNEKYVKMPVVTNAQWFEYVQKRCI